MGFEPNEEKTTVDNLPENQFEGGGADIDIDGLSAASPVAAPKRARISMRSRASADSSASQSTADTAKSKGMPPRTEESTPPPVRRPIMRPSSEFGYLFSDDEPVDNHMDDSFSHRLDGLAYEGRKDDEQYSSVMEGTQPSMVRRPENRMSADSASSRSSQEARRTDRSSRFSRRNRSAAPEAAPQPEVISEPLISEPAPPEETRNYFEPSGEQRDFREDDYRPRRRRDGDEYDYDRRRHQPDYGTHPDAYPPYGSYSTPYPPGYPYPYGYPVPAQPGYPPYGYPVQPGYPPYAYPVQPQQGYPAYVYAVPPGMVYPAGVIPVQTLPAEQNAPQQAQPAPEPAAPAKKETPAEEEVLPHPLPPVSLLRKSGESKEKNAEPAPAAKKTPVDDKPAAAPAPSGNGNSRFNRRSRSTEEKSAADISNAIHKDSSAAPAKEPAAPAADSFDWFSDHGSNTSGGGDKPTPTSGGSSRFNRRSK